MGREGKGKGMGMGRERTGRGRGSEGEGMEKGRDWQAWQDKGRGGVGWGQGRGGEGRGGAPVELEHFLGPGLERLRHESNLDVCASGDLELVE